MKIRTDYPIYIDPNFDEIVELATSHWDTIRFLVIDDLDALLIGSGYGNTHETLVVYAKQYFSCKRLWTSNDSILFHKNGIAYIEVDCWDKPLRDGKWTKYFSETNSQKLKDLIRESGLSL